MPEPYAEAYAHWIAAQMDLYSGELARYNNSISLFNNIYEEYRAEYSRTYLPKSSGKRFQYKGVVL